MLRAKYGIHDTNSILGHSEVLGFLTHETLGLLSTDIAEIASKIPAISMQLGRPFVVRDKLRLWGVGT